MAATRSTMTKSSEHTEADFATRDFLRALTLPTQTPAVPEEIRKRAAELLKHYSNAPDTQSAEQMCRASSSTPDKFESDAVSSGEEKPRTLSGGISWLLAEDSERARNVIVVVGLAASLLAASTAIGFTFFAR